MLMVQGRAARVYTSDHHGHEGQRSLPAGQWSHPGAMAGAQHTSTLSQTGTQRSSCGNVKLRVCIALHITAAFLSHAAAAALGCSCYDC